MKLTNPIGMFKMMGGHVVMHAGFLTAICIFQYSSIFKNSYCIITGEIEQDAVIELITVHASSVLLLIIAEVLNAK